MTRYRSARSSLAHSHGHIAEAADWSVLDETTIDKNGAAVEVRDVIKRVARNLGRSYWWGQFIEMDDACQVGFTIAAMKANVARDELANGYFPRWIKQQIVNADPTCGSAFGGVTVRALAKRLGEGATHLRAVERETVTAIQQASARLATGEIDQRAFVDVTADLRARLEAVQREVADARRYADLRRQPDEHAVPGCDRWADGVRVREALRKVLTQKQARSVFLYHVYGYELREIADMDGVSISAVFKRIKGAEARLRESLGDRLNNEDHTSYSQVEACARAA